jgi:uncharacterized repeat protein (TIGR04138 family)
MEVMVRLQRLLQQDKRYKREAYLFVHEALNYAQRVLKMGSPITPEQGRAGGTREQRHLTGQQLCEAIRQYALEQFGYLARVVLKSWGIHSTSDFGEIVYSLIEIGYMNKSKSDRREDFDNVYDFREAFERDFEIRRGSTDAESE